MNIKKKISALWLSAVLTLLFVGCGTVRRINYPYHHTYMPVDSENYGFTNVYPRSFTIYPFKNVSWYPEAAERGRQAVCGAFSLIGPCASVAETDQMASLPFTALDALRVARKQGSDALVLGEVVTQDHIWLLLVAYNYVHMKLWVYDTRNGKLLWKGSSWSTDYDVGLSVILPLLATPIETGVNHILWSRKTLDLYNRIAVDFIHELRPDVLAVK